MTKRYEQVVECNRCGIRGGLEEVLVRIGKREAIFDLCMDCREPLEDFVETVPHERPKRRRIAGGALDVDSPDQIPTTPRT